MKLTKTQAAKQLGVSRPTIYSLIQRGVLTPDENGLIALEGADESEEALKCPPTLHSVMQSSGKLKERYKDKYIAQLETEVQLLRQEIVKLRNELEQNDYLDRKRDRDMLISALMEAIKQWGPDPESRLDRKQSPNSEESGR